MRCHTRVGSRSLAVLVIAAACAAPVAIDQRDVLGAIAARYPAFFPDGGGLVHPRFGDPDIVQRGRAIPIELLRRDGEPAPRAALIAPRMSAADARRCLDGDAVPGCWPLALGDARAERIDASTVHARFAAHADGAPSGGYDLVVDGARATRAVWLRDDDPAAPRPIHVVQLSDLHVGKRAASLERHLAEIIRDVDALAPDLVVVTGDLVERGEDAGQAERAAAILRAIDAPVVTVMGGHDVGRSVAARLRRGYGAGWEHDARAFHPSLVVSVVLGGWELVAFDTGPAAGLGTRALDRGIGADTLARLHGVLAGARAAGRRGVVLASHAPSRSSVLGGRGLGRGTVARMRDGGAQLEAMILAAAATGQRVIHLSGHTHWSDVYEAEAGPHGLRFARWAALSPCPRVVHGNAALVTTQSASEAGLFVKTSAHGYGFAELWLDENVRVAHHRYGAAPNRRACGGG